MKCLTKQWLLVYWSVLWIPTLVTQLATYCGDSLKRPRPTFPPLSLPPLQSPVWDSSLCFTSFTVWIVYRHFEWSWNLSNCWVGSGCNGVTLLPTPTPQIINNTVDLLYLYLRNLITKGVSSCFEELWTKEQVSNNKNYRDVGIGPKLKFVLLCIISSQLKISHHLSPWNIY